MRRKALQWFIEEEKRRVLGNWANGTTGKEQAIGSLNTLYQLAAAAGDVQAMRDISTTTAQVRAAAIPRIPVEEPLEPSPLFFPAQDTLS
ncbi:hypothetical protein [Paenibacillus hamazuiensis]|uniref:hypothetical protein n=1 Tax=Paenibacillus hamazuiensis TaxID=2936508 RepID=UPI00200EDECE|nr:hypothetical protein [Paenibacillus hamazuiensis]